MVVRKSLNKVNRVIEKIRNLLYNKEGNIKVTKIYYTGGFIYGKRRTSTEDEGRYGNEGIL